MPTPKINNKAPIFKGECTGNKNVSLSDFKVYLLAMFK